MLHFVLKNLPFVENLCITNIQKIIIPSSKVILIFYTTDNF